MKHTVIAVVLATAMSPTAFGEDAADSETVSSRYVSIGGGYAASSEYGYSEPRRVTAEIDAGAGLTAAYGARLGERFRVEGALAMSWQDLVSTGYNGPRPVVWPQEWEWPETYPIANGELGLYRLTVNGYVDLVKTGPVRPYVGVGAGVVSVDLDDGAVEGVGSAFTGEVIAGVSVPIAKSAILFADVRYVYVGPIQIDSDDDNVGDSSFAIDGAHATAGVRVHF